MTNQNTPAAVVKPDEKKDDAVDRVSSQTAGAFDAAKRAVSAAIARLQAATRDGARSVMGADVAGKVSAGSEAEVQQMLGDAERVAHDADSQAFAAGAGNVVQALLGAGGEGKDEGKPLDMSFAMLGNLSPTMIFNAAKVQETFVAKKDDSLIV